jgi:hypothetical protein
MVLDSLFALVKLEFTPVPEKHTSSNNFMVDCLAFNLSTHQMGSYSSSVRFELPVTAQTEPILSGDVGVFFASFNINNAVQYLELIVNIFHPFFEPILIDFTLKQVS